MGPTTHLLSNSQSALSFSHISSLVSSSSSSLFPCNCKFSSFFSGGSIIQKRMAAPSMMEMWATAGSTIASFMFLWAIIRPYFPRELRDFLGKFTHRIMRRFHPYIRIDIHEYTGERFQRSQAFAAVESYLSRKWKTAQNLKAEVGTDGKKVMLTMDDQERITDEYRGVTVWWICSKILPSNTNSMSFHPEPEKRFFRLKFHKRDRELIAESYLEYVMKEGTEIRAKLRQKKLYTNTSGMWTSIVFEHPATFETIAMESEKKREIIDDLVSFSKSKEFYAGIGKAWKRGYLLYGPPGTGKSTMIAAIANLLHYNVYDLELTAVKDNTELRKLLIQTTSKSVIVIEDIDCSLELTGQRKNKQPKVEAIDKEITKKVSEKVGKEDGGSQSKVTLSGLLNFIDGLWSASGGERLIVFTTNYVEKLDPALIRRGRMDKHIELSYCSFEGFQVLAKNYLRIDSHPMFDEVKRLMAETKVIPADIAENLMPKSFNEDADKRLKKLIQFLEEAKEADILKNVVAKEAEILINTNKEVKEQNLLTKDAAAQTEDDMMNLE